MDAKIDMIQRSSLMTSQSQSTMRSSEGDSGQLADIEEGDENTNSFRDVVDDDESDFAPSRSPSPLAAKGLRRTQQPSGQDSSSHKFPPFQEVDIDEIETAGDTEPEEEVGDDDEIEEWEPSPTIPPMPSMQDSPHSRPTGKHMAVPPSPVFAADLKANRLMASKSQPSKRISSLASVLEKTRALSLDGDPRDSIVVIPNKKARAEAVASGGPNTEYVPGPGEVDVAKKKKRYVDYGRSLVLGDTKLY